MEQKEVKIIGLTIKQCGNLKATQLALDPENHLTVVKGEVGSGKTTLNRAMRLGTQGSNTLTDKNLYGEIDIETQLMDGDTPVFVGVRTKENGSLETVLYTRDANGKKITNPVIDGQKATPAAYFSSMQTALTWRLKELTSENPTTQRNLLLELYANELERVGVIFDKKHPNYVGTIIDKIEKARAQRSYLDSKRKECGGIADDMRAKGIDFEARRQLIQIEPLRQQIAELRAAIQFKKTNVNTARETELQAIQNKGTETLNKLRAANDTILTENRAIIAENNRNAQSLVEFNAAIDNVTANLNRISFIPAEVTAKAIAEFKDYAPQPTQHALKKELVFDSSGRCISAQSDDFTPEINALINDYQNIGSEYIEVANRPLEAVNTTQEESQLVQLEAQEKTAIAYNTDALAVNSYHDWKEANELVNELSRDYFKKLTEIETGVDGLKICPEYTVNEKGERVAKGDDIFLMYDGSYDPEYFANPNKELRKLSAYSDTQKPVICLLVQKYLLSKKPKVMPYLWIDDVPIDRKTRDLLERMGNELGLCLFVSWTGDFNAETLQDGEILIENGHVILPVEK